MAAKDNGSSILNEVVNGWQSLRDPAIISDGTIFKGNVEVASNEHALALYI